MVAAAAALATILYARSTVREAEKTTTQLGEIGDASRAALAEQRSQTEALGTAHGEEMAERGRVAESELIRERLLHIDRVAELLLDLVNVARAEELNPPPTFTTPSLLTTTRLPAMLLRLHSAVLILESLGGPRLLVAGALAARGYSQMPGSALAVQSTAIKALSDVESLVRNQEALSLGITPGLAP